MASTKNTHPTGTLKKLVDAGKKNTRVVGSVERWLLAQPKDTSRPTDVIHPSAMVKPDWCHRAEYYTLQGAEPAPSKFKASMKQYLVFEEGHRIHDRWQTWFWNMGKIYGKWQCLSPLCSKTFYELSPSVCLYCGSGIKYREVPVFSPAHSISGHADGWLKGFKDDLLLEIKSVGEGSVRWEDPAGWKAYDQNFKKYWSDMHQPFYSHLMQAQVYMKLLEIMNPEDHPKEAVFIYESKVDQEIKELIVRKSDFGVTELFDAALMINECIKNQTPPSCNVSQGKSCYKCEVYND